MSKMGPMVIISMTPAGVLKLALLAPPYTLPNQRVLQVPNLNHESGNTKQNMADGITIKPGRWPQSGTAQLPTSAFYALISLF